MRPDKTFEKVETMRSQVARLAGFFGEREGTYLLIGKCIVSGSENYNQEHYFKPGTVLGRREEALCVEQALHRAADYVQQQAIEDPEILAGNTLSNKRLEELIKTRNHTRAAQGKSPFLNTYLEHLAQKSPDYREGIITFGEIVANRLASQREDNTSQMTITASKLTRTTDPLMRRLYKEFESICEISERLK